MAHQHLKLPARDTGPAQEASRSLADKPESLISGSGAQRLAVDRTPKGLAASGSDLHLVEGNPVLLKILLSLGNRGLDLRVLAPKNDRVVHVHAVAR